MPPSLRIKHPANARPKLAIAAGRKNRRDCQCGARHKQPEAQVVESRKRHIRRADLQRHEIVAKPAKERWNDHKEHHQDAVPCNQYVPEVSVRRTVTNSRGCQACAFHTHVLNPGVHQFHPHVDGERNRDKARETRNNQVENPDVLVVRGHEPTGKEPAVVFMFVAVNGGVCHICLLESFCRQDVRFPARPCEFPRRFRGPTCAHQRTSLTQIKLYCRRNLNLKGRFPSHHGKLGRFFGVAPQK